MVALVWYLQDPFFNPGIVGQKQYTRNIMNCSGLQYHDHETHFFYVDENGTSLYLNLHSLYTSV